MSSSNDTNVKTSPRSLTPKGLTMPNAKRRLDGVSGLLVVTDPEHIMMNLWAEENTPAHHINGGLVPIDVILHECSVECYGRNPGFSPFPHDGHLYRRSFSERDLRVASAIVQWLATGVGQGFLAKFQAALKNK